MKKVIIFYASYGGGHLSAAKSILQYIEKNFPLINVEMIDCMKYVSKHIEKMTTAAYGEKFILVLKRGCFLKLVKIVIN